jgi:hypothetical protein
LRASLVQRYVTCGNPSCKCAKGERHGPMWYLTVTLGPGRTTGGIVATEKVEQVRGWVNNYHKVQGASGKDSPRSIGNCGGASATNSANASAE